MKGFDKFCKSQDYINIKNSLFNYLNRKSEIKKVVYKLNLQNSQQAVDVGCGISPVTPFPKRTIFVDISRQSLNFLNKKGYKTVYGDITEIPLKGNFADIIFCSEVLEHISNYKKALKEMKRVVKRNGKIIITVPVHMYYWGFDDEFVGHLRRFDPLDFKRELEKLNLKVIIEKPIGSRLERILTKTIVKLFNKKEKISMGNNLFLVRIANYILYLLVKISLLFTSKKSTSIMLYCCEKQY